jgi:AmmeMemoRadiSam system protein B
MLERILEGAGPGGAGVPKALVAPHIDLGRGGEVYGAAYRRLEAVRVRSGEPPRYVILGISHHPLEKAYALTTKDYETPLGRVDTDRAFVEALGARCRTDFLTDEIAHRDEHSIEFQMLFLRHLMGDDPFTVVPILCGSLAGSVRAGTEPDGEVDEMVGALASILDPRRDILVAAVDFAHLGRQFGQELTVTDEVLRDAEAADRRMMEPMAARDARAFFRFIAGEKDARNVCGVPAIYTLLRLLGQGEEGTVERYGQAVDRRNHNIVTFAALAFGP